MADEEEAESQSSGVDDQFSQMIKQQVMSDLDEDTALMLLAMNGEADDNTMKMAMLNAMRDD